MELTVQSMTGQSSAEKIEVADAVFGKEFNEALVHQVVIAYQAGMRSGTRAQKNRAAVRGGGRKPWRQKGTGRARAGTIRGPIWRGGGRTFPACTTNFSQKVNKKMYRGAMRSIFAELARLQRLTVVDSITLEAPRTSELVGKLTDHGRDVLMIMADDNLNVFLAARNLPYVQVLCVDEIDPVSLVGHQQIVVEKAAISKIEEWLQ